MRLRSGFYKLGVSTALKQFAQRAAVGMGTGALIGAAIAPRDEDRLRLAVLSGLADLPVLAISHAPDAYRYIKETKPLTALMQRARF
jgi:hypothetical protein